MYFGLLLVTAATFLTTRRKVVAQVGSRDKKVSDEAVAYLRRVLKPVPWVVFGFGLVLASCSIAIFRFAFVGEAPAEEPISGLLHNYPLVKNTFFGVIYALPAVGALLLPFAVRAKLPGSAARLMRWCILLGGVAFLLFGAMNCTTLLHKGLCGLLRHQIWQARGHPHLNLLWPNRCRSGLCNSLVRVNTAVPAHPSGCRGSGSRVRPVTASAFHPFRVMSRPLRDATVGLLPTGRAVEVESVELHMNGTIGVTNPTEEFFDELGRRGHEPLLGKVAGTLRFEMVQGLCTEHWYVRVDKGDVRVSRENLEADAVLRAGRDLFDRVASGEVSLLPRAMRGEVAGEGDRSLVIALGRLLPGPHGPSEGRLSTSRRRGQA